MAKQNYNKKNSNYKKNKRGTSRNQKSRDSREIKDFKQNDDSSAISERPANNPLYFIPSSQAGLLESLTAFSFPKVMGKEQNIDSGYSDVSGEISIDLPTASRIRVSPTIGPISQSGGADLTLDPINVAATSTFVALSAMNNKQTLYAPQDVQLMVLSVGQLYAIEEYIRRALKFSFLIDSRNLAVPRTYFAAMGIDFDDYRANIANYRDQFNVLITKINSIRFMYNIPYLKKCYEIYRSAYRDSMTDMYGVHFIVPATTWKLNDIKNEFGGGLDTINVVPSQGTRPLSEYLEILDDLISAVRTSATFNVIYSDILSLYDRSGFETLELPLYAVSELMDIEYNPLFNIMLRHGTIMGMNNAEPDGSAPEKYQTSNNDVVSDPDNNALFIQYMFDQATNYVSYDRLVNFYETNSPDAGTRFEMTRWMVISDTTETQSVSGTPGFRTVDPILQDTVINSVALFLGDTELENLVGNAFISLTSTTMHNMARYAKMANLPMLVYTDTDATRHIIDGCYMDDVDSWSTVDAQYLKNIANQTMIYYFGSM